MKHHGSSWAVFVLAILSAAIVVIAAARPRRPALPPLDLHVNGVHGPYNLRDSQGRLVLFNFRSVDPGRLYRGSGFPRNQKIHTRTGWEVHPAAYETSFLFQFLRSKGIHTVISLQEVTQQTYYGEEGYYAYWSKHTGYRIGIVSLSVKDGHAYDLDTRSLRKYPPADRRFGLRATAQFIDLMRGRSRAEGAVYLHCDAGKDRTGVVVAGYELWRNQGRPGDALWRQVRDRYLVSNTLIARDPEAVLYAGRQSACPGEQPAANFVCGDWLDKLRPKLELIAQL